MVFNAASYSAFMVSYAQQQGPFDTLTRVAKYIHYPFEWILLPLIVVQLVSTLVLGLLAGLTFGLVLLPLSLLWMVLLGPILATSWLWIRVPILRPILLLPGVAYAQLVSSYAAMMPEMGDWESRGMKQALCVSWPHSLHVFLYRPEQPIEAMVDDS